MPAPWPKRSRSEWLLTETCFDWQKLAHYETIFTLTNGYAGVRGSLEMSPFIADPGMYVSGIYAPAKWQREIVNLPCWLQLDATMDGFPFDLKKGRVLKYERTLDLRQGLLLTDLTWADDAKRSWRWESARLVHKKEKHVALLWGKLTPLSTSGAITLNNIIDAHRMKYRSPSHEVMYKGHTVTDLGQAVQCTTVINGTGHEVSIATALKTNARGAKRSCTCHDDKIIETWRLPVTRGKPLYFEKRAVIYTTREVDNAAAAARAALETVSAKSVKVLFGAHTKAWDRAWQVADIRIDGDDEAQRELRFSLFSLLALANDFDPGSSIGAKGLHGNGYQGLVFWDTETYLVPFYTFTDPKTARTLLTYRYRMLPGARENARLCQRRGAKYPWVSADDGQEYTFRRDGWQEHQHGDIAYAVDQYLQVTGDRSFYRDAGAEVIISTAQYYADRVTWDDAGKRYITENMGGPDEIHTGVTNNAFSNYLIAWNLRRALQAVEDLKAAGTWRRLRPRLKVSNADLQLWADIADKIAVPFSRRHGFHEQFEGYFKLKEKKIDRSRTKMEYTGPVQRSFKPTKVAQQADTMMLYHLFGDDFPAAVKAAGFRYYDPRCSHTSTLSASVFAAVAARAGLAADAYRLFRKSLETDLGPTAECDSGIHVACCGGNWQTVVMGFGGLSLRDGRPSFSPALPEQWKKLDFQIKWRGKTIRVTITPTGIRLRTAKGKVKAWVRDELVTVTPKAKVY